MGRREGGGREGGEESSFLFPCLGEPGKEAKRRGEGRREKGGERREEAKRRGEERKREATPSAGILAKGWPALRLPA